MNCHEARESLSSYLDGELPAREREELEEHLERCEACRQELLEMEALVEICRSLGEEPLPAGFQERLRARLVGWAPRVRRLSLSLADWFGASLQLGWARWVAAVSLVVFLGCSFLAMAGVAGGRWALPVPSLAPPPVASNSSPPGTGPLGEEGTTVGLTGAEVASSDRTAGLGTGVAGPVVAPDLRPKVTAGGVSLPAGDLSGDRVSRQGEMRLTVSDLETAVSRLSRLAEGAGGYLQDSTVTSNGGQRQAVVVVRVPVASLEGVMEQARDLGRVKEQKITRRSLSQEWLDADARLRIMRTQEQALVELLGKARNIDEMLRIQYELYRLQGDIESLETRLKYLQEAMDMASLQVVLQEVKGGPLWQRAQAAFWGTVRTMGQWTQEAVVYVAQAFPVVLLAGLAWLMYARFGKGRWQR